MYILYYYYIYDIYFLRASRLLASRARDGAQAGRALARARAGERRSHSRPQRTFCPGKDPHFFITEQDFKTFGRVRSSIHLQCAFGKCGGVPKCYSRRFVNPTFDVNQSRPPHPHTPLPWVPILNPVLKMVFLQKIWESMAEESGGTTKSTPKAKYETPISPLPPQL